MDNLPLHRINGYLFIGLDSLDGQSDVTDISGFSQLDTLSGYLVVNRTQLTDLSGLASLDTIMSTLINIGHNPYLQNINGLMQQHVYSNIFTVNIEFNPLLTDLSGLSGMKALGRLRIRENGSLKKLNGLQNLEYIGPNFDSSYGFKLSNNAIDTISGIDLKLCRLLYISEPKLKCIEQLHIKKFNLGELKLLNNPLLSNTDGFLIDTVTGFIEFEISDNDSIIHLDGIHPTNNTNGNYVKIKNNYALERVNFLSEIVSNDLIEIKNNHSLKQINLDRFNHDYFNSAAYDVIEISDNDSLQNISLDSLRGHGTITIKNNKNLIDITSSFINSPDTIREITIINNPRLKDLGPIQNVTTVRKINITGCDSLDQVNFHRLANFFPYSNSGDQRVTISHANRIWGFDSLVRAYGLDMSADTIEGFEHLKSCTTIRSKGTVLRGFHSLDSLNGLLMTDFVFVEELAFDSLRALSASVVFENFFAPVPLFNSLDTTLNAVSLGLYVRNPNALENLGQFRLKHIGFSKYAAPTVVPDQWHVGYNDASTHPLDFEFYVSLNPHPVIFETFPHFEKLKILFFIDNDSLQTIDAFSNATISSQITVKYNPLLTDCSALCQILTQNIQYVEVEDNAAPCNLPDIYTLYCDTLTNSVSVALPSTGSDLWLYPNPSHSAVRLSETSQAYIPAGVLTLHDMQGRELQRITIAQPATSHPFDVSGLLPGIYYLRFVGDDQTVRAAKLVVE